MPMTTRQATAEARRRFGPKGVARLDRRITWKEIDRVRAREELKTLRENKPVRPDSADEDATLEYRTAFRAWRKKEEELMTIALSTRCDVGILTDEIGFAMFGIRGSGDTFEDAFADVDRRAAKK
jgi:hypothetical protein